MTHTVRGQQLTGPTTPWLCFIALGAIAFVLSCHLMASKPTLTSDTSFSSAGRMLGAARSAISGQLQLMTDIYYHAGTTGRVNDQHWPDTWFRTMRRKLIPRQHVHLSGNQTAEMTPMLWLAIRADPHNIDNYLLAAFWLSTSAGLNDPDLAHEVLREGRRHNPRDARLPLEQALVYLRAGRTVEAGRALDLALTLWPGREDPDSDTARQARRYALTYRALLHESDNEPEQAVARWTELLPLHDQPNEVHARIALLQSGAEPPVHSSRVWQRMLQHADSQRTECDHDHHHNHHHDHHHDS